MKHRVLVRVEARDSHWAHVVIPTWLPSVLVLIKLSDIPFNLELRNLPIRLLAKANMGADTSDDLDLSDWEMMLPPPQERGQFYVYDVGDGSRCCPIDHFVFITDNKHDEIKLEGVGGQTVLSWEVKGHDARYEWFNTKAEALYRMARVLEGNVYFMEFGDKDEAT